MPSSLDTNHKDEPTLESRPAGMAHQLPRLETCLNCGAPVTGNFCAQCGQENENQTVAVKLLFADVLAEIASFDSKIFRTMIPLIFRPGFLTNQYNAGKRIRYLSPLKIYLTMSVIFFLMLSWKQPPMHVAVNDTPHHTAAVRQALIQAGIPKASVHQQGNSIVLGNEESFDISHLPKTVEDYDRQQKTLKAGKDPRFVQFLKRRVIMVRQSPQALAQGLLNDIPKMMFFLLPLFALLYKLVYLRSKRLYIEHLIFLLHCHAFGYLALTIAILANQALVSGLLSLAALLYFFVALKAVYRQSWLKTFLKFNILAFNYFVLLSFCFVLTLAAAFALL